MRLKSLRLAAIVLAASTSLASAAGTGGIRLSDTDISSPSLRSTWKDLLAIAAPTYAGQPPGAFAAQVKDKFGRTVEASMLLSDVSCTESGCDVRVVADGKVIAEERMCSVSDSLSLAADGTFVEACGERLVIPIPAQ